MLFFCLGCGGLIWLGDVLGAGLGDEPARQLAF